MARFPENSPLLHDINAGLIGTKTNPLTPQQFVAVEALHSSSKQGLQISTDSSFSLEINSSLLAVKLDGTMCGFALICRTVSCHSQRILLLFEEAHKDGASPMKWQKV